MKILAIESSCDDTSIAIIDSGKVLSNLISSQEIHNLYGGIVPELASRKHIEIISKLMKSALSKANCKLEEIDGIGVTNSPGLAGSLLVGINFAKGLAISLGKPIVPINHIEGHIFSGNIEQADVQFPIMSMVVSGGHTSIFKVNSFADYEIVGSTIDDAAGEAFDKIAKMLGLGYPGGPLIDKLALTGDRKKYKFPRSLLNKDNFNFSFSGLKTSVRYFLEEHFKDGIPESDLNDICASAQEAIIDVLTKKLIKASKSYSCSTVVIGGGVSANSRLRENLETSAKANNIKAIFPSMEYCVDNAAMIGFIAEKKLIHKIEQKEKIDLRFTADPRAIRA